MDARHGTDFLNPVFFKDLRQAMRSRFLLGMGVVVALIEGIIAYCYWRYGQGDTAQDVDALRMMTVIYCFLMVICVGAGGLFPVSVMAQERRVEGLDPLMGTCLTPWQVLKGKLLAILTGMGIPMALSVPLWLFLRPYYLFFGFVAVFGLVLLAVLGGLVVSCYREGAMNTARNWGLVPFLALGPIFAAMGGLFVEGNSAEISWKDKVVCIAAGVSVLVLALALAYGALCHRQQERTRVLRISAVILALAWLPLLGWLNDWNWREALVSWGAVVTVEAAGLLFLASCERPLPSRRQAQEAPRNLLLRLLAFPWTTGASGGIVFSTLLAMAGGIVGYLAAAAGNRIQDDIILTSSLCFCYGLFYAGIAQVMRRWLRLHPVVTYICIGSLVAVLNSVLVILGVEGALILTPFFWVSDLWHWGLESAVLIVGAFAIAVNFSFWCDSLDHLDGNVDRR